jgi:hypothetical protein
MTTTLGGPCLPIREAKLDVPVGPGASRETLTRLEIQAIEEARANLVNCLRTAFGYSPGQAAAAVDQAARRIAALLKKGLRLPHLHVHVMLYMSRLAHESLKLCP